MRYVVVALSLVIVVGCTSSGKEDTAAGRTAASEPTSIPESEIGLAPGTVFEQPEQQAIPFNTTDPGDSELRPRPNAEFPPVIPHSIQGIGPISIDDNPCLECHDADVAGDVGAVAVPASHRTDLRNSPGEIGEKVTGARLVCTACHVEAAARD